MTIYEAIFARKSVRKYKIEEISSTVIASIETFYQNVQGLFMGINTELRVISCIDDKEKVALFGVKAPYYLALYTEDNGKCMMNAGYIMEQLSLYLTSRGLGSCYVGSPLVSKKYTSYHGRKIAVLLAFGKAKGSVSRKQVDFKRIDMNRLCAFKEPPRQWMRQILEVARLAPSSRNSQPWRFLVYDKKIHIFSKKTGGILTPKLRDLNFGILFCHILLAAEEMWLDLDLIRLENISQKNFQNSEYILSAVLTK